MIVLSAAADKIRLPYPILLIIAGMGLGVTAMSITKGLGISHKWKIRRSQ